MNTSGKSGQQSLRLNIQGGAGQIGVAVVSAISGTLRANTTFFEAVAIPVENAESVVVDLISFLHLSAASPPAAGPLREYQAVLDTNEGSPINACLITLPAEESWEDRFLLAVVGAPVDVQGAHLVLDTDSPQLKNFIEHLPAGVVVHDREGGIICANALASSLLGMSVDDLIGVSAFEDVWNFCLDDGTTMPHEEFPAVKSLKTQRNLHDILVGVRGETHESTTWLLCNTLLVRDTSDDVVKVVVSFTDCTKLRNTQQALLRSEERLNLILRGTNDAPWDWDLQSNDIYYSDRWWAMIGRAPGELPPDHELWHHLVHPDDVLTVAEIFGSALKVGTTYEVEFRLQHKDGHYVPVMSRGFVLRDGSGKAIRVSGTNTDVSERKNAEKSIYQLAYFDQLTGLPNRRNLIEHLHKAFSRAARSGQVGAVLFLDLDNFKDLNDTLGHDIGDLMLRQFGDRLQQLLRESDQLARLGGDEFVIVVEDLDASVITAAEVAEAIANKVMEAASKKFFLPKMDYTITPSIGIALFDSLADSVETVLKQADLAMYSAKAKGSGLLRFFDPEMQHAVNARSALEIALRNAIINNEFELYCQPQFNVDRQLSGGEMLLRWHHPEQGLLGPACFIPMAEACGLIIPIGAWVLREACRAIASWSMDPVLGQLTFSVNVSAKQLHTKDFVRHTLDIVTSANVAPQCLCLELTESLLAQDVNNATEKMSILRSHGIVFSIDDFGTGYSSLSYLQRFPLYELKIDKSFVHDANATAIVEVIISLAKKLRLRVIAEGVETASQYEFLKGNGCNFFQGYFLGRPVPLADFVEQFSGARDAGL